MSKANRVGLVVGVGPSQGLGAALARRFAREGLHVFLAGRTEARLFEMAEEIGRAGGGATAVPIDTTQSEDVVKLFERVDAEGGSLDLVAYNAGNAAVGSLVEMDEQFFEDVWRVVCLGGFLVGREASRRMVAQGCGSILFTGATASLRSRPPFAAFASAKAGLRALAAGLAREVGPQGVHVGHVVVDGMIDGDQLNQRFPQLRAQQGENGMLNIEAIAQTFWNLHAQPPSAWSFEIDLRPQGENW
ncbi:MAG: glucose 1-dehydrogenase [bacterium TMED88]|nr:glucose 1-dehydrogenase [Deltaproteobacteria bacterium]OUV23456.1 MAG: glucose 1-dehydrogenase [bacterium TMED88]